MKKGQKLIMVAVQALDPSSSRLLRKAATLAKARTCTLELVHIIALPYGPGVDRRPGVRQAAQDIVDDRKRRLLKLAAAPELRGIKTSAVVIWDFPVADGLVRHVLRRRPVLLLAQSQRHARLARPFLNNTDWELIRKCPCPLWLSKSAVLNPKAVVIAALDPLHTHAKPASLDALILQHAMSIAGSPSRVLACHAFALPAPALIDSAVEAYWIGMSDEEIKRSQAMLNRQIARLTDAYRVPPKNRLLVTGDPVSVLTRIVRKHRPAALVMGAVSRSALQRLVIGSTAERVIDALSCDVLIVKPRGFKTRVARRGPRAGMLAFA